MESQPRKRLARFANAPAKDEALAKRPKPSEHATAASSVRASTAQPAGGGHAAVLAPGLREAESVALFSKAPLALSAARQADFHQPVARMPQFQAGNLQKAAQMVSKPAACSVSPALWLSLAESTDRDTDAASKPLPRRVRRQRARG